jgi:hypothetical protein
MVLNFTMGVPDPLATGARLGTVSCMTDILGKLKFLHFVSTGILLANMTGKFYEKLFLCVIYIGGGLCG